MIYRQETTSVSDLVAHQRNKFFSLFPEKPGLCYRIANRMHQALAGLRNFALARLAPEIKVVVSEQILEVPLMLRHLREHDSTVLDFGGFESLLPLQLSALGYKVTVQDQRRYPFAHPNLSVLREDLFAPSPAPHREYDIVMSVSTIEHLGLGHYGDAVMEDGDKRALKILWDRVRKGGRMMISLPAGRPAVQRGYRVYDEAAVHAVSPTVPRILWYAKSGREGTWQESSAKEIGAIAYQEPLAQLPVEALAFVICDKD